MNIKNIKKVYIVGSLRNPKIVDFDVALTDLGYDVFSGWFGAGETADQSWKFYEQAKGNTFREGLYSNAAQHIFQFDRRFLDRADIAVLLLPAGRSGHLEIGYATGRKKRTFVVFEEEPEDRWDVMYNFVERVFFSQKEFLDFMAAGAPKPRRRKFIYGR